MKKTFLSIIFSLPLLAMSQETLTLEKAIEIASQNHPSFNATQITIQKHEALKEAPAILPKMEFGASFGQMNTRLLDQSFSVSQSFNPAIAKAKRAYASTAAEQSNIKLDILKKDMAFEIKKIWEQMSYINAQMDNLHLQKNTWKSFFDFANKKYNIGESDIIEKITAEIKYDEILQEIKELEVEHIYYQTLLRSLLNTDKKFNFYFKDFLPKKTLVIDSSKITNHPMIQHIHQQSKLAEANVNIMEAELKPEYTFGYFIQSIRGEQNVGSRIEDYNIIPRFQGIDIGVSIPIFKNGIKTAVEVAKTDALIYNAEAQALEMKFKNHLKEIESQQKILTTKIDYYTNTAIPKTDAISNSARKYFESGETGYLEYIQILEIRYELEQKNLEATRDYNLLTLQLEYLLEN